MVMGRGCVCLRKLPPIIRVASENGLMRTENSSTAGRKSETFQGSAD